MGNCNNNNGRYDVEAAGSSRKKVAEGVPLSQFPANIQKIQELAKQICPEDWEDVLQESVLILLEGEKYKDEVDLICLAKKRCKKQNEVCYKRGTCYGRTREEQGIEYYADPKTKEQFGSGRRIDIDDKTVDYVANMQKIIWMVKTLRGNVSLRTCSDRKTFRVSSHVQQKQDYFYLRQYFFGFCEKNLKSSIGVYKMRRRKNGQIR